MCPRIDEIIKGIALKEDNGEGNIKMKLVFGSHERKTTFDSEKKNLRRILEKFLYRVHVTWYSSYLRK